MKKNLYLFLVMLFAGITSMFAQKISIKDFAMQAGETKTLDITLESDAFKSKAISADFVLPEGLTVVPNEDDEVITILAKCMMPSSSIRANGNVAMALVGATVAEGAKVIANMTVTASEDFAGGEIVITNQRVAGSAIADATVSVELAVPAIEVYPSLMDGENEITLNNHSNISVETADAIKVQFENGAAIKLAMYSICEAIEEDGELTYGDEIATDLLSLSTIGYAEFDEAIVFEQGKQYWVRIMAWDNENPTSTPVATYECMINGSYVAPIEVNPSLLAGEDEITLNNHSNISVETADAIKVQFENGAAIKLAMYSICEAIEEDGELTYGDEIATDLLSLNNIGYAAFDEAIVFEQGKQYWVRVMAWDNEDPTSTPIATYECLFNGSYVAPLMVYPSLVGDDDVELNNHGNVSVNMASSLKVEFENGANVIGVTYLINEMNMGQDEDGIFWTVGAELAAGEANLNSIAFAELDETLYFLQGKKYQLTVTAFENAADPTEIGTYTYEFNGSYVEPIVANIVISEAGYATYWAPFTVDLSKSQSNVKAYIITGINEDNTIAMQLIEDGVIPAFQPVLLKGDAGTIIPESGEEEEYTNPDGILEAVEEDSPATIGNYVLQIQNGVLGFYQVSEEVQPTVKAYHATLVAPGKGRVKAFYFGEATAISEMAATSNNANIYDLNGRKVAKTQNGVFVVNGKKVIK